MKPEADRRPEIYLAGAESVGESAVAVWPFAVWPCWEPNSTLFWPSPSSNKSLLSLYSFGFLQFRRCAPEEDVPAQYQLDGWGDVERVMHHQGPSGVPEIIRWNSSSCCNWNDSGGIAYVYRLEEHELQFDRLTRWVGADTNRCTWLAEIFNPPRLDVSDQDSVLTFKFWSSR